MNLDGIDKWILDVQTPVGQEQLNCLQCFLGSALSPSTHINLSISKFLGYSLLLLVLEYTKIHNIK